MYKNTLLVYITLTGFVVQGNIYLIPNQSKHKLKR